MSQYNVSQKSDQELFFKSIMGDKACQLGQQLQLCWGFLEHSAQFIDTPALAGFQLGNGHVEG